MYHTTIFIYVTRYAKTWGNGAPLIDYIWHIIKLAFMIFLGEGSVNLDIILFAYMQNFCSRPKDT